MAPPLLSDALDPKADPNSKFKTYRSLRDVEATVNLWVRDPYGLEMKDEDK